MSKTRNRRFRLGKCKKEKRPLNVRMRSKVATEEILVRTGKQSEIEYKNVWM